MGISLPGLGSGLDTAALITQLMAIEAAPQALLSARVASSNSTIADLQALNLKVSSLATLAATTRTTAGLTAFATSTSSTSVTAKAGSTAVAGSLDIVVRAVAQGQTSVTAPMTAWPDSPAVLTVVAADGSTTQVSAASSSVDDVVAAVNASGGSVKAARVQAGVDGAGVPQYRIQFSSASTGAAAAFSVHRGDSASVAAGTSIDLLSEPGAASVRVAADAEVVLWQGTAAEQVVRSASNTFTGLLGGVDITVSKASADPVTVTVARDATVVSAAAKALTDAIKSIFGTIDSKSAASMTTNADGSTVSKLGPFTGDSTVRSARLALASAVSMPVDGASPSQIGISFLKDGTLVLDPAALTAALEKDPAGTETMLAAISDRVAVAATSISDKYEGSLTASITGQETVVKSMNEQIENWTRRLDDRRATLERTYSALEVRMSALNSQSAWLTSQLAALPTTSGSGSK
ncbi:MAG: flagellar filament capping protein FliD [Leifsonia sp.]